MTEHHTANQSGVTLVEMIIAIVIISIASVALLQGLGLQTQRNVDPMIQTQAQALARQFLDEAMSRTFFETSADPRVDPSISQAEALDSATDTSARDNNATNRLAFNNIFEYQDYNQPAQNIDGSSIDELSGYQINIDIDHSPGLILGTITNPVASCPPAIFLITVTVTDPRGQSVQLQGYRASYFDSQSRYGC